MFDSDAVNENRISFDQDRQTEIEESCGGVESRETEHLPMYDGEETTTGTVEEMLENHSDEE
jgi:hypothetical protein